MHRHIALLGIAILVGMSAASRACDIESGPGRLALVELFTSEGCSSCPPADRRLGRIPDRELGSDKAVALAWHVDYWDYIGWKDSFAQPAFSGRQRWLVQANHRSTSFTPHFFVSGKEVFDWRGDLTAAVERVNRQPAQARIRLKAASATPGKLDLDITATSQPGTDALALYVVVTENKLVSQVRAGENAGTTLSHSHVVRAAMQPVAMNQGAAVFRRSLTLDPRWNPRELNVVAFVQSMATAEVVQTLSAEHCLGETSPGAR